MTTPPKVRLYRSHRDDSVARTQRGEGAQAAARTTAAAAPAPPSPRSPAAGGANDQAKPNAAPTLAQGIEAVKAEGLTGRQLRLARRIAAMHGIDVESEHEAVVILRERGIDPFHRDSMSLVIAKAGERAKGADTPKPGNNLALRPEAGTPSNMRPFSQIAPMKMPPKPSLPPREALTEDKRAAEIMRIQRDIARRRRSRMMWLGLRLLLMVGIPTFVAGWYYFYVATPLYETRSQFLIQQADSAVVGVGSSVLSGIQLNPDSVAVQSYLTSKNAMVRLQDEAGFKTAFQDPSLDPLLRLPADATDDDAFKTYENMVSVGYDPTAGVLDLKVIAPDPQLSEEFSLALLRYAEGMVDDMTLRVRGDQMAGAEENYDKAEARVREAQNQVQALQEKLGVLDAASESGLVMSQIGQLESERTKKELELAQLLQNARPNASRVDGVQGDIGRLNEMIAETRSKLTESSDSRGSLAQISGGLRIAEAELTTRQALLAASAEQLEIARVEANKQVRYLSLSIPPIAPQNATYPKSLSNTTVAFLIFAGIYLMLSLTASILREQVSS